jgi:hypothetical protein
MQFKRLESLVESLLSDISLAENNNGLDEIVISNLCKCLKQNIVEASTVPPHLASIEPQNKYLTAVQTVLNCYVTILCSPVLYVKNKTKLKLLDILKRSR